MRYPAIKNTSFSSMRNALRLLNLFTMDEPELTVSEIAEKLDVAISTAHRLTSTLLHEGFLVKDPTTKYYRLGASILAMGNTVLSQIELCRFSTAILEQLVKETGETAHLSILKDTQVVYLFKIDSLHPVHLLSHAGRQNPAYCTSSGQAILAFEKESLIDKVIEEGLTLYTKHTITNSIKFRDMLKKVRNNGIAISKEEMHEGVISLAAPVKNLQGKVIASVSIAGPTSRIHHQNLDYFINAVKKAAFDISSKIGSRTHIKVPLN